ncbi:MAG TPA: flagellin [Mesorhizobium sp.]|jgi:flagellin|nr:flagellin [Mesorhizobium sp.]
MASINTNAQALTALRSLNAVNKSLEVTQTRISTGLRVGEASDNAAYWSLATTMRSDNLALSTVQDSLGLGAAKIDTAYTGMNKAIDTVNQIKQKLVAANGSTTADKAKFQTEIKALQDQLKSYADAATFSGTNMLSVDTTSGTATAGVANDVKIVSAFNRTAAGVASVTTVDIKVQDVKLYEAYATATAAQEGILDATRLGTTGARTASATVTLGTDAAGDTFAVSSMQLTDGTLYAADAQIAKMITATEAALKEMTTAATTLGVAKQRTELQKTFTQSLMDSIDRGVGQLVDADMNKESTRLQALQVQQQLAIQALSIANGGSQAILSLFR